MDAIDKKLLGFLQEDTKRTTKELSLLLNLSVTAVYERIKKLEREYLNHLNPYLNTNYTGDFEPYQYTNRKANLLRI